MYIGHEMIRPLRHIVKSLRIKYNKLISNNNFEILNKFPKFYKFLNECTNYLSNNIYFKNISAPTLLIKACEINSTKILNVLLEIGLKIDSNQLNLNGLNCLQLAILNRNTMLISIILDNTNGLEGFEINQYSDDKLMNLVGIVRCFALTGDLTSFLTFMSVSIFKYREYIVVS